MPGNPIDLDEVEEFMEDEYTQEDYDAQDEVEPEEDEDDEYEAAGARPRGRRAGGRACLPGARRARMLCCARCACAACLPPGAACRRLLWPAHVCGAVMAAALRLGSLCVPAEAAGLGEAPYDGRGPHHPADPYEEDEEYADEEEEEAAAALAAEEGADFEGGAVTRSGCPAAPSGCDHRGVYRTAMILNSPVQRAPALAAPLIQTSAVHAAACREGRAGVSGTI
jgi:hypothetical protein